MKTMYICHIIFIERPGVTFPHNTHTDSIEYRVELLLTLKKILWFELNLFNELTKLKLMIVTYG